MQQDQFDKIVNLWKKEIESIDVDGFSRVIESVNFFPMQSRYYPHSLAWKANFNFKDGISDGVNTIVVPSMWEIELNKLFISKFGDKWKEGPNYGEFQFHNNLCDYMTYQKHRFIIQFYPDQFLSLLRNESIEKILEK
jgi:hypothetical protein